MTELKISGFRSSWLLQFSLYPFLNLGSSANWIFVLTVVSYVLVLQSCFGCFIFSVIVFLFLCWNQWFFLAFTRPLTWWFNEKCGCMLLHSRDFFSCGFCKLLHSPWSYFLTFFHTHPAGARVSHTNTTPPILSAVISGDVTNRRQTQAIKQLLRQKVHLRSSCSKPKLLQGFPLFFQPLLHSCTTSFTYLIFLNVSI